MKFNSTEAWYIDHWKSFPNVIRENGENQPPCWKYEKRSTNAIRKLAEKEIIVITDEDEEKVYFQINKENLDKLEAKDYIL
jgi:hypothetical protein